MGNKSNIIVQKENSLVNAIYRLSLEETRIFNYVIARIDPAKHCYDHTKEFSIAELCEFYNLSKDNAYKYFKKALDELFERKITYFDNDRQTYITTRIIVNKSDNKEGVLGLKFSDEISELIAIRKDFLSYKLEQTKGMTSTNAIRLYEVVLNTLKREKKKSKEFTFAEIKKLLGFKEDEYQRFTDFNRRVLKVAKEQINKNTDITFDFSITKHGRYVTGCVLLFDWKKQSEQKIIEQVETFELAKEEENQNIDITNPFSQVSPEEVKELIKSDLKEYIEMSDRDISFMLKLYDNDKLINQINHTLDAHSNNEIKKTKVAHFKYFIKQG